MLLHRFFSSSLFITVFNHLHQYGLTDIYLIVWVNIQQYFVYSVAQMVPSLSLGALPVGSCASWTHCVMCVRVFSTSLLSGTIVKSLSHVQLFATPQTVVCQTPPSVGFFGKNTGVGCHFLIQGIFRKY